MSYSASADDLRADCSHCTGLCCVAPGFSASSDFAIDKPAGTPCVHLGPGFGCTIHPELRERGFAGCTVFDCFGAGQRITAAAGVDWRAAPATAAATFAAFGVARQLHELLWYLAEAMTRPVPDEILDGLATARAQVERCAALPVDDLAHVDVAAHRPAVAVLLRRTSAVVRAAAPGPRLDRAGADLVGRDLRRLDLRAADLRGAYLLGADLRGADLALADLLGADLRGADIRGADLSRCLYLTRMQLDSTRRDGATAVPAALADADAAILAEPRFET